MRAKRSKKYRKIMQQYELSFGFREPFQVLVDSHFLLAIYAFSMPLLPALERTLHGKVKPFITKCCLAALNDRNEQHRKALAKAASDDKSNTYRPGRRPHFLPPPTELPLRHCDHGERGILSETECLLELVSGGASDALLGNGDETQKKTPKNKEHYIVATADEEAGEKVLPSPQQGGLKRKRESGSGFHFRRDLDLRSLLRNIPGTPIIYVKRSVMILEELSGASLGIRRREEKEKMGRGLLGKRKREGEDGDDDSDDEGNDEGYRARLAANGLTYETAEGNQRRGLTRAKGPNPLSVKKKKDKKPTGAAPKPKSKAGPSEAEANKPKTKRRRKHVTSKKSGEAETTTNQSHEGETAAPAAEE